MIDESKVSLKEDGWAVQFELRDEWVVFKGDRLAVYSLYRKRSISRGKIPLSQDTLWGRLAKSLWDSYRDNGKSNTKVFLVFIEPGREEPIRFKRLDTP